eukprot:XP_024436746.1 early nodulin-like protein 1 isoform X2 [Populus trichocarpa]
MESQGSLCLLWALLACYLFSFSVAYNSFYVGGNDGWVINPSESYNHWAERNRFQVNDSLVFKYNKGSDSVLRVTKDDYNSCNTKKPLKTMDSGSSVFQFDKSGPFFFISGNEDNCRKGQKLIVAVLAVRTKQTPTPAYPPATSPKAPSPEGHNPAQAPSRSSAPIANAPTGAPGPSPVTKTPQISPVPSKSPSPSPYAKPPAPAHSPESLTGSPGPSPVPLKSPSPLANTPSPSYHPVASPTPARSPSPSSPTPAKPPSSSTPSPTPESSSGPSLSPRSNEADLAPAPAPAASWAATPSTTMVIVASLLISSAISGWP